MWTYDPEPDAFFYTENGTVQLVVPADQGRSLVPNASAVMLPGLKAKAQKALDNSFSVENLATVECVGGAWRTTYEAAGAFLNAVQLANANHETSCVVTDAKGESHELSVEDTLEIARLAGTAYRKRYLRYREIQRKIDLAGTIDDLEAITYW